jgi:prolyl-tRNA synthetase
VKETLEEQQDFVKDITKMSDDFDRWYTDVVRKAELADWSGVRGMMVVRPYGGRCGRRSSAPSTT